MPLGEENAMLLDLGLDGRRFLFVPELFVFHRRRPTQIEFLKQMLKYGKGRGLLFKKYGVRASSNLRLALVFAFTLALLAADPVLFATLYSISILGIAAYTVVREENARAETFPLALSAILICHIFYPAGCIWGWLSPAPYANSLDRKSEDDPLYCYPYDSFQELSRQRQAPALSAPDLPAIGRS
jgi:hypothetical protein